MTLIVILNATLAAGIVSVIVALHHRAIVLDRRQHGRIGTVPVPEAAPARPAPRTPQYWPAATGRVRRPALVAD